VRLRHTLHPSQIQNFNQDISRPQTRWGQAPSVWHGSGTEQKHTLVGSATWMREGAGDMSRLVERKESVLPRDTISLAGWQKNRIKVEKTLLKVPQRCRRCNGRRKEYERLNLKGRDVQRCEKLNSLNDVTRLNSTRDQRMSLESE